MNKGYYVAKRWQATVAFVFLFKISTCVGEQPVSQEMLFEDPLTAVEYYRMTIEYAVNRSSWQHEFEALHIYKKAGEMGQVKAEGRTVWDFQFSLGTDSMCTRQKTVTVWRRGGPRTSWRMHAVTTLPGNGMPICGIFVHEGV